MERLLNPDEWLAERNTRVLLDVRSPGEYAQGHIPDAISFPLFTDAERAKVGTLYKQQGKDVAFTVGLDIVGPKMAGFVRRASQIAPGKQIAVHCWRGGQRSRSMAWLLRAAGFDVAVLNGGYKVYRRFVLDFFERSPCQLIVVGGRTGAGKTRVLHALRALGEQVVDLEALARHKGSSFGSIGEDGQPTVEQFENDLFDAFQQLDWSKKIWLENESRSIGRVYIPEGLWKRMKNSPLLNIEIPHTDRVKNLVRDYAAFPAGELEQAFLRIDKKLGGLRLNEALEALRLGHYERAAEIALAYYDKTYQHGLDNNPSPDIRILKLEHSDPEKIALACREISRGC
ncbi:MAG: tRNA 2-selenouridine(34) synthase MnmH [Saprospiraceae bacterium]|nr:tRNA 2-selenouridine(34) synthase MnmH [Saprospiraceae bacterium]